MWMKDFLLDDTDTNAPSDMSVTCDSSHNLSKEKYGNSAPPQKSCGGKYTNRTDAKEVEGDNKITCQCDEQLLKFKAFFFLFFAGFGATFPYLGVYFKQIGLNASYVGVLAGIRPLIQFISGPFWALIADKYKARKVILLFSILAWLVMTLLLAFPKPHLTCKVSNSTKTTRGIASKISDKRFKIPYPDDFQGRFGFNKYTKHCRNNCRKETMRRRTTDDDYISKQITYNRYIVKRMTDVKYSGGIINKRKSRYSVNSSEMVLSLEYDDKPGGKHPPSLKQELYWKRGKTPESETAEEVVHEKFYIERNENEIKELFYIFLALIVVGEFLEAPSFIMIDTALLDHLGDDKKHYGKTRLFGSIGYGVASFSVGALLDKFQYEFCGKTLTNYLVIFYIFSSAMVIAFIFGLCFVKFKYTDTTEESKPVDCIMVFLSIKYGSFLCICWFCGFSHGAIMNFLNWYLEDLGASKLMMGVATCCRCAAIILGFFTSSYLIDRIGPIALICWSLASYVGSFFGYSLIHNPWWAIPVEVVQGMIYAVSWSSCITYLGDIAPPNTAATMQGILQGVYWGLGTGTGTIAGGILINHVGVRTSFRIGGCIGCVIFCLFVALQFWISRKENHQTLDERERNQS